MGASKSPNAWTRTSARHASGHNVAGASWQTVKGGKVSGKHQAETANTGSESQEAFGFFTRLADGKAGHRSNRPTSARPAGKAREDGRNKGNANSKSLSNPGYFARMQQQREREKRLERHRRLEAAKKKEAPPPSRERSGGGLRAAAAVTGQRGTAKQDSGGSSPSWGIPAAVQQPPGQGVGIRNFASVVKANSRNAAPKSSATQPKRNPAASSRDAGSATRKPQRLEAEARCPKSKVGWIIGTKGCEMRKLEAATGCEMRLTDKVLEPLSDDDEPQHVFHVHGPTSEAVDACLLRIEQIILSPVHPSKLAQHFPQYPAHSGARKSGGSTAKKKTKRMGKAVTPKKTSEQMLKDGGWKCVRKHKHRVFERDIGYQKKQTISMSLTPSDYRVEKARQTDLLRKDELAQIWRESKGTFYPQGRTQKATAQ